MPLFPILYGPHNDCVIGNIYGASVDSIGADQSTLTPQLREEQHNQDLTPVLTALGI